jgi:hypothetical protein
VPAAEVEEKVVVPSFNAVVKWERKLMSLQDYCKAGLKDKKATADQMK